MKIRKAKLEDAEWILEIRNNEKIRKLSKNQEIIDLYTHKKWFENKLENKKDIYLVWEENNIIFWFIRLDFIKDGEYLISIALEPSYQWKWLWTNLVKQAISKLKSWDKIFADILSNNKVSINFFEKLWFKKIYEDKTELKYLYIVSETND